MPSRALLFCMPIISLLCSCSDNSIEKSADGVPATVLDDRTRLIGSWDYVSATYDGKPFELGKDPSISITKTGWTINRNGQTIESTWSIDPVSSPKQLTQTVKPDDATSFSMKSIYRFDLDGTLVLCEPDHPDKPRPTKFVANKGDGQFLIKLRRRQDH